MQCEWLEDQTRMTGYHVINNLYSVARLNATACYGQGPAMPFLQAHSQTDIETVTVLLKVTPPPLPFNHREKEREREREE